MIEAMPMICRRCALSPFDEAAAAAYAPQPEALQADELSRFPFIYRADKPSRRVVLLSMI